MKPFFSVVIPTYNRAERLRQALDSVLTQSFTDFEVIVVDDGSTDNTEEVVTSISDQRLRYLKKKNEERSIARNFGIEQAKGSYINFLDSDDRFYSNHLQIAFDLLHQHNNPEVGHLGYEMIDSNGKVLLQRNDLNERIPERLLHENILHGNAIFIRKDIANQVSFIPSDKAVISEDWYVWIRLAARFHIYYDNTITSAIVEHQERSLKNIDPDKLIASTEVIIYHLQKDSKFIDRYQARLKYFFANHYTLVTLILALTKQRRWDTLCYLVKAIQYDWTVMRRRRFLASVKHWF